MKRVALGAALCALLSVVAFSSPSVAADPPQFQVDPFWPKPLPNNWMLRPGGERRRRIPTTMSGCCSARAR